MRETLFNWLQHSIAGARCLDLFAGSGALGLEALSRGAREAVFVEQVPSVRGSVSSRSASSRDTLSTDIDLKRDAVRGFSFESSGSTSVTYGP